MPTANIPTYLRRYTDLPALLRLLTDKQLTLLDPKDGDDRNDAFFMSLYKERKKLKMVLPSAFAVTGDITTGGVLERSVRRVHSV